MAKVSFNNAVRPLRQLYDNSLEDSQLYRIEELRYQVREEMLARYPLHNQISYGLMHSHSTAEGLVNRRAYIEQGIGWMDAVFSFFYSQRDSILALTTIEEVKAYDWSTSWQALLAQDPQISIEDTQAIPN